MFAILLDGLTLLIVIGLGWLALVFISAGLGALIGKVIASLRGMLRS
jgi:hypothetical protein